MYTLRPTITRLAGNRKPLGRRSRPADDPLEIAHLKKDAPDLHGTPSLVLISSRTTSSSP